MTDINDTQNASENQENVPQLPEFVTKNLKWLQFALGLVLGLLTDYCLFFFDRTSSANSLSGWLWVVVFAVFMIGSRKIENTYKIVLRIARLWYIICVGAAVLVLLTLLIVAPDILSAQV